MSRAGVKTKAKVGGGGPPLASASEGPRRTPPNGGDPRNAPGATILSPSRVTLYQLKDVCEITMGQAPDGESYNTEGLGLPLIAGAGDFGDKHPLTKKHTTAAGKVCKTGDIVLGIRASIGEKVLADREYCLGRGVAGLRAGHLLEPRFLWHWLDHNREILSSKGKGATFKQVNRDDIGTLMISLPPLPEQRRIAEILDRALSIRARRIESITRIELVSQSLFRDMFGDPIRNERGWEILPFGEVCETRLGKMLDQKQQTGQDSRPYLRNANVQWFRFDLESIHEMDFDKKSRETHSLQVGDLLICEGGEPGRCAIWRGQIQECYFQKALHRARPDLKKAAPEYLAWLLWCYSKGGGLKDYITSATIAHLTGEKLNVLPIALPPLALQRVFVERLKGIEKVKDAQLQSLTKIDCLFASLQHQAFHGEL